MWSRPSWGDVQREGVSVIVRSWTRRVWREGDEDGLRLADLDFDLGIVRESV